MSGRVAVVTGAGSGIGAACARWLAATGDAVAVVDLDAAAASTVAGEIAAAGGRALALPCDVADEGAVAAAAERAIAELGEPRVLVTSAGLVGPGDVGELPLASWERTLAVNLTGVFLWARALVPCFERAGGGAIVTVASTAALAGVAGSAAYCASKGGVVALTRALAAELGPLGVRANTVCPGTVESPFSLPGLLARGDGDLAAGRRATAEHYPVGRIGQPDDVAALVAFLAGDDAGFVTGSSFTVDGGLLGRLPVPVPRTSDPKHEEETR